MFKRNLIETAVMTTVLALAPAALMAADDSRSSSSQSQSGQTSAGRQDSATAGARSGSQSDRSSSRIGQGTFNEQKFVQKAMEGNQFEIQLGQLAQQKGENQEVKQLAQMLAQDHQQANQTLSKAAGGQAGASGAAARPGQPDAQASGSSSSGSQQLGPVFQAKLADFQKLQGAEFDEAFVMDQLADHVKSVLKYRMASQQAQNPQIKEYATQTLPKLQSHLQQLQQLAGWDEKRKE